MSKENNQDYLVSLSREALDNLPFGAYVIDKEGNILFFNKEMVKISGVKDAAGVEGQNVFEVPSYKKYGLLSFIERGLKGDSFCLKGIQYVSHVGKKESFRDYYGIPIKDGKGNVEKLLCIVEDTTLRRRLEEQVVADLEEKEKLLNDIRSRVDIDMQKVNEVLNSTKGYIRNQFKKREL